MIYAAIALSSCFDVKEHLVVRPDGSGLLSIEVKGESALYESSAEFGLDRYLSESRSHYPPATMESMKILFPGESFDIQRVPDDATDLTVQVEFKDINDFLSSPYAALKSIDMGVDQGKLHIRARTGFDGVAACRMTEKRERHPYYGVMMEELCASAGEAKHQFRVTLPAVAASQNGNTGGFDVTWDFANDLTDSTGTDFTTVMSAACSAEDIGFTPRSPMRIDLQPFSALTSAKTPLRADKPSAADYRGKLQFQPLELSVTNTFSYTASLHLTNIAGLIGLASVPADLAPDQWGSVRLVRAVDGDGTDLLIPDKKRQESIGPQSTEWFDGSRVNGGDAHQKHHPLTLYFRPPAWNSNRISLLSAELNLVFFTSEKLVKIENAVPENIIQDQTRRDSGGSGGRKTKRIIAPEFEDAGIELFVEEAIDLGTALMILVKIRSPHATINDIGFFDRHGNPPSRIVSDAPAGWGDDRQGIITILPGHPEPPLSMVCRIRYGGEPVSVTFDINNLSMANTNTDS